MDGNCFYIAISIALYGNQLGHTELHQSVARHVNINYNHIFALEGTTQDDDEAAHLCTDNISNDNLWAAEDAFIATAGFLQRDFIIFISTKKISPVI